MTFVKPALLLCTAFLLTACLVETPEDKVARLAQFNGKTLEQVKASIGPPTLHQGNTAIWLLNESRTYYAPQYEFINGVRLYVGQISRTERSYCKYTATLSGNRIQTSMYDGETCKRFAPPLPKKK
jgi:hypothetical protein